VAEKVTLIIVVWCLMQLAYYIFVEKNIGISLIWLVLSGLNAANWGYWCEDSS
jgi:hypothetical protein